MTDLNDNSKPAMNQPQMVSISEAEYIELKEDSRFLRALMNAGVSSWDGWGFAQVSFENEGEA